MRNRNNSLLKTACLAQLPQQPMPRWCIMCVRIFRRDSLLGPAPTSACVPMQQQHYRNIETEFKLVHLENKVNVVQSKNQRLEETLDESLDDFREDQNITRIQLENIASLHHSTCENDWIHLANSCYLFSSENATFSDAVKWRTSVKPGANILEIRTPEEEKWIDFYLKSQGVKRIWIGLTDVVKENDFVFVSDGQKPNYTNWKNEPNNAGGSEDCTEKYTDSNWNDLRCDKKLSFLCKV
ncbi:C-type lectin lectoxin-Thr1-like [Saccostrea echinata]|uniref:C-type lectin lectoxin-Thr1-like n=1 Tax=Saccostrea echinata TaxID=191078 RepID=UPI002A7ECC9B|nr:C-type lectin lectoxin-Thr1-like [Saccostrea echinata]